MLDQVFWFIIIVIVVYFFITGILYLTETPNSKFGGGELISAAIIGEKVLNSDLQPSTLSTLSTPASSPASTPKSTPKHAEKQNTTSAKIDGAKKKSPRKSRPNNVGTCSKKKSYDEYDDEKLLGEHLPKFADSFDNIVIDGNNMLFQYAISHGKSPCSTADEYVENISNMVKMLDKHFNGKNLYYVFKDSETKKQEDDLMRITKTDTARLAHKKIFEDLYKKYPNNRFVVAYGDEKYRDDYAAIWLADTLPDDTILLSRDRYRDVSDMKSQKLKFTTYGKRASKINKIINKPFNFVTKGSVKSALVGYSFNKNKDSGFYQKNKNKKSHASETVYIIGKVMS